MTADSVLDPFDLRSGQAVRRFFCEIRQQRASNCRARLDGEPGTRARRRWCMRQRFGVAKFSQMSGARSGRRNRVCATRSFCSIQNRFRRFAWYRISSAKAISRRQSFRASVGAVRAEFAAADAKNCRNIRANRALLRWRNFFKLRSPVANSRHRSTRESRPHAPR